MRYLMILALAGAAGCAAEPEAPDGAALFAENCAACHGADGRGGDEVLKRLGVQPADLTRIAARNGGKFPMVQVLSTIDGFHRNRLPASTMPEWGAILQGRTAQVDLGDGVITPVPEQLLAVAEHLRDIQR